MTPLIVVAGSLNMDLVIRAPHIPRPGETIIGHDFRTLPGGKGANQAVAAARLGGQTAMLGKVGDDAFAGVLLANLAEAGVDSRYVTPEAGASTGVALIVVEESGQNSIVVASGANMRLLPADVDAAEELIAAASVLLLQLESRLDTVERAAQIARRHGVTVILNPAPAQQLPAGLLALVDLLVPNESETALLAELPLDTDEQAAIAAGVLLRSVRGAVILTLGERGALLARAGETRRFPAFKITPVDTTAAGDAFLGGLAVALAEGERLEEAIRWGNAAGALAATRLGAQPSLPHRMELEELLAGGAIHE